MPGCGVRLAVILNWKAAKTETEESDRITSHITQLLLLFTLGNFEVILIIHLLFMFQLSGSCSDTVNIVRAFQISRILQDNDMLAYFVGPSQFFKSVDRCHQQYHGDSLF
jgi:hypothetical protein